jgi:GR25 family glycosyltransferase involved in LPS biosynthesis
MVEMDWSFFKNIKTINLEERNDRMEECEKMFQKLNVPNVFHRVKRHPKGGEVGCWNSHMEIIKEAYNSGAEHVLIFEDDAIPTADMTQENLNECIRFMTENKDWNILLLGCIPQVFFFPSLKIRGYKNIYCGKAWATHSYVMSRKFMKTVMDIEYSGTPLDDFYSSFGHVYSHTPSMFIQADMGTDVQKFDVYWAKQIWNSYCEWHIQQGACPLLYTSFALTLFILLALIMVMIYPAQKFIWAGLAIVVFLLLVSFRL